MDYRTLVNKLDAISKGVVAEEVAPAANTATATPASVIQKYVDLAKTPDQAQAYIDPKDGVVKWIDKNSETGQGSPRAMPSDWIQRYAPDLAKALADTGVGTEQKGLFGMNNGTKVDLAKVQQLAATAGAAATSDAFAKEKLAQLKALTDKLEASLGGAATPAATPAPQAAKPAVTKEGVIADELLESFGYQTTDEGVGSALLKGAGKALPGVGLALGAKDAYDRVKAGDYTGAAIAGAGGVANLIPGLGTAAQLGLMGLQAGRDKARTGSWMPDDTEIAAASAAPAAGAPQAAKPAAGVDPKVQALQQKLIAAGAKIKADGIMGPQTQAAMKQFPTVKESVSESMASLRDRLAMIESEQQVDEISLKGAWDAAKGIGSALKFGAQNAGVKGIAGAGLNAAERGAIRTGQVAANVAKNPAVQSAAKTAGLAGAGAAAGYAMAGKPAPAPAKPTKPTGSPQAAKPAATPAVTADPELVKQIQAIMGELADIESPEVLAQLSRSREVLTKAGQQ